MPSPLPGTRANAAINCRHNGGIKRHGEEAPDLRPRGHQGRARVRRDTGDDLVRDARRHRVNALGFDRAGIAVAETIGGIERQMFYKSMTTFADHRVWQDVYHVPARGMKLYVKFQADVVTEFTVMSFKEK